MKTRSFFRHFTVLAATIGLMVLGLALVGRHQGGLFTSASAAAGDHLQIAPANSQNFGTSADGIWTMSNAAPGQSVSGSIQLRSVGTFTPQNTTLRLAAILGGSGSQLLLSHLFITQMSFGGADVLPVFSACASGGHLTLAGLGACSGATLPLPPAGGGAVFAMTLQVDPAGGNELQGLTAGTLQFVFTLTDTTPDALPFTFAGPSPSPSPSPSAIATATASPTATATSTTGGQTGSGSGTIVVRHTAPSPVADKAFTLSVSGAGGVSGPGPEQRSGVIAVGQPRTVSVVGPESINQDGIEGTVVIDKVVCVSDKAGALQVDQAKSVQVTLTQANEVVTCTFTSSIAAGARQAGPTPKAPSTGSGSMLGSDQTVGMWLLVVAGLLGVAWSAGVTVAVARSRNGDRP
jgi:hypothetical protein